MRGPFTFSAQCPTCKNEISQGPRDPDEVRRLLKEDSLSFYCELCDLEWSPSQQELTNVESLLSLIHEVVDPRAERLKLDPSSAMNGNIRIILFRDLAEATARTESARETFTVMTDSIPSGLPHPDGAQSIHNASRALRVARMEMLKAHTRLNDFLNRGIVPEDLKRSGAG
jgi:hypothetical protein